VKKTEIREHLVDRFMKFSSWNGFVRAVSCLKRFCRGKAKLSPRSIEDTQEAERFIIRETQKFWYRDGIKCLKERKPLSPRSSIIALHPMIDHDGILRIGGHLNKASFPVDERKSCHSSRKISHC
jgi:hypothetical protein